MGLRTQPFAQFEQKTLTISLVIITAYMAVEVIRWFDYKQPCFIRQMQGIC